MLGVGYWVSFWPDENILKSQSDDGCDSTDMIKTLYFGVGFFLACEFYLFLKYPLWLMQL